MTEGAKLSRMSKRYYWMKFYNDFFDSKRIKKLRKLAGGDTYTIIYLKILLLAIKTDGVIAFTGLEDEFADELALDIDEEPENVRITLTYLLNTGLAESSDNVSYYFPYAVANVGSEGSSAKRMRDYRKRKASLCDTDVTRALRLSDGEIDTRDKIQDTREETRDKGKESIKESAPYSATAWEEFDRKYGGRHG